MWSQVAKQSNDFSGAPGNNLNEDPATSNLNTVLGQLTFLPTFDFQATGAIQPTGAEIGQPITGTPYNPNGPPVEVAVVDSNGVLTGYDGGVWLTLNNPGGDPSVTLSGGGSMAAPAMASGGNAIFGDLTVAAGAYGLSLTTSNGDNLPDTTSQQFDIHSVASQVQCNGAKCANNLNDTSNPKQQKLNATTLTGSGGQLLLALDPASGFWTTAAVAHDCGGYLPGGYTFEDPDMSTINLISSNVGKTIQSFVTLPAANQSAINTMAAAQQWCLGAPYDFTTNDMGLLASQVDGGQVALPDGTMGYVGLLPNCPAPPAVPTTPCVSNRLGTKVKGSNPLMAVFEIDVTIPANFAPGLDPVGRA
jgi:hypothetical protein